MTDGKLIICDNCGMEMDVNDLVAHIEELAKRLKEKP